MTLFATLQPLWRLSRQVARAAVAQVSPQARPPLAARQKGCRSRRRPLVQRGPLYLFRISEAPRSQNRLGDMNDRPVGGIAVSPSLLRFRWSR